MSKACRLYLISPPVIEDADAFARTLDDALSGGDVAAVQIRLKDVSEAEIARVVAAAMPVAHRHDVALILNDDPALAARLGCDGVHVGQSDAPLKDARRILGKDRMIGVTCHDSRHLAMIAAEDGADYVAFGAFFPTTTKDAPTTAEPELLTIWQETMEVPCVAIGGVTVETAGALARAGADFIAVSGGVWNYKSGPRAAVAAFNAELDKVVR
jgi:thiamine-phosphate pyrophosphorylase